MRRALKAEELIDFDVRNFEQEKERISGLLKALASESEETKARLANELVEIVKNQHERIAKRSQAAFLLGTSSKSLGIRGSVKTTNVLVKTLGLEFMGSLQQRVNSSRNHAVIKADGLRLVFLQGLVFSVLAISPAQGKAIVNELNGRIEDVQMREWLEKVSKCAGTG